PVVPAARRRLARGLPRLRPRDGPRRARAARLGAREPRRGLPRGARPDRRARAVEGLRCALRAVVGPLRLRTREPRHAALGRGLGLTRLPAPRPRGARAGAARARPRADPPARRAPPAHPDRGRTPGPLARALRP